MGRWVLIILISIISGVAVGILLTRAQVLAAPEQPLAYSHRTHVQAGIECLYCHSEAARSTIAGIPSMQKCVGCHSVIATDSPEVQTLNEFWNTGQTIAWVRVNKQPDFVYFSHQAHVRSGSNCETCHGDVGQMDTVHPVLKMDMGWCLDCHYQAAPEKIGRLVDCLTCHK
jgi:hypothetical protein